MTSQSNPRPPLPTTTPFSPQTYRQGEQSGISSASTQSIKQQPHTASTSAPRPFVPRRFNTGTSPSGHPGHAIQGQSHHGPGTAQPSQSYYYSSQESTHGFYPHASYQQQHSHASTHYPPHVSNVPSYTGVEEAKVDREGT